MTSLSERLRAMLDEAGSERATLEAQRGTLAAERDAKLDAIRTEYANRIAAIDEELSTVKRLERALEPPEERRRKYAKQAPAPKSEAKNTPSHRFRPTEAKLRAVLAAIETGHETIPEITEVVDFSRGTVENAVIHLREDGAIRLAGEKNASENSATKVRIYRITPRGTEQLDAERNLNGAPA